MAVRHGFCLSFAVSEGFFAPMNIGVVRHELNTKQKLSFACDIAGYIPVVCLFAEEGFFRA